MVKNKMINNFLIIRYIGKDDKLGLRINKDFFIYNFKDNKKEKGQFLPEVLEFLNAHKVKLNDNFSIIVNLGPGSFSGLRISLAVAKGMKISKNVRIFGYNNSDLKSFDLENIEKLINENLIEKKLIQPIYISKLN
tara:strand:+ start:223 stop:630 length:408 start_codon:yes stop_codon:yes gene_type:complete